MIIKRSSKYNAKGEFWHEGRKVEISRIFGGVAFHGINKFAVILGEEQFFNETHYFILAEGETGSGESLTDVIQMCKRLDAEYRNQRWFGRLDENVKQTIAICNKQLYNTGYRNVVVMDTPRIGEWIDEQISLIDMLVKPTEKRLHFFQESMIAAELKSLPTKDARADLFPRTTALGNVVAGMLRYTGDPVSVDPSVEPEPMY